MLVTADGDEVEVTDVEIEKLAEPATVYNLEVTDCHTYSGKGDYYLDIDDDPVPRVQKHHIF